MLNLIDRIEMAKIELGNYKIHCAIDNERSDWRPLDAYFAGNFEWGQARETKCNFQCDSIVSLINMSNSQRWLFVGVYAVLGVGPDPEFDGFFINSRKSAALHISTDEQSSKSQKRFERRTWLVKTIVRVYWSAEFEKKGCPSSTCQASMEFACHSRCSGRFSDRITHHGEPDSRMFLASTLSPISKPACSMSVAPMVVLDFGNAGPSMRIPAMVAIKSCVH